MVGNTARDVLLTVGNEILEATMSKRSRWYEYLNYRPLLEKYFKEDPDFRWEAAPKPRLTDQSYKDDYQKKTAKMSEEEMMERTRNKDWILTEKEPLFDAADVARVGKDLFVQRSTTTNEAGFRWLKQHFSDHRVHDVFFADTEPRHIDATWIPLKPGMALISKDRPPLKDEFVELMEKNDWDLIESAEPHHTEETKPKLTKSTPYLSLNMLKIDRDTVCVMEQEEAQIKQLRDLGFDVIEVPFWDAGAFGGGLHCATADVHRKGDCEDYFPNQIEGY
jgi:glycine amidinotransferase